MKTILLLTSVISLLICDDKLVSSIEKTLQEVINQSKNKKISDIKIDYNPFSATKAIKVKNGEKKNKIIKDIPKKPILSMIFNKNAFINGKWYKVNDKFADYVIKKIYQDIVVLKKNNRYMRLKLPQSKMVLKIQQRQ